MALPSSGTIRMSQINSELGRTASLSISLDSAESGGIGYPSINTASPSRPNNSRPAAISEWYGYNHDAGPSLTVTPSSVFLGSNFSTFSLNINTQGVWNYSDNQSWIYPSSYQGFGNSTITIFVQNNFGSSTRFGAITISVIGASRFVSVIQQGSF